MNDYSYITVEQRKRTREIDDALALGNWARAHDLVEEQKHADYALLTWLETRMPENFIVDNWLNSDGGKAFFRHVLKPRAPAVVPELREKLRVALAAHEASTRTLDLAQQAMLTAMRTQATEAQALAEAMLAAEQATSA